MDAQNKQTSSGIGALLCSAPLSSNLDTRPPLLDGVHIGVAVVDGAASATLLRSIGRRVFARCELGNGRDRLCAPCGLGQHFRANEIGRTHRVDGGRRGRCVMETVRVTTR